MAATLADGVTVMKNAARRAGNCYEPHILLNEMGAKVKGAGTETITVLVSSGNSNGTTHNGAGTVSEAGTVAASMTSGDVVRGLVWESPT